MTAPAGSVRKLPWWKGARGEWYVVVQGILALLVLLGPRTWPGGPRLFASHPAVPVLTGVLLLVAGGALMAAGGRWLGTNLTALPRPRERATLVRSGPFRLVRHPIYSGSLLAVFGWALLVRGPLTLVYAAIVLGFLDIKSRREEQWLREKFADYDTYAKRVRKLIPFVY